MIDLVEGRDFSGIDYMQLFHLVKGRLDERGLNDPRVLLTGYNAEADRESGRERESTWAMPIDEVERAVSNPFLNHPIMYSHVRRPGGEPTVAAYDGSLLRRRDQEEPDEYVPLLGYTLASARLAEFQDSSRR